MARKRRNKIVYIPNQSLHEKWWSDDLEGLKQLHLEREYQKKLAKSKKEIISMETKNLIRDLISALNGDEYEEARRITEQIIATGDEELIKEAEEVNSVL